MLVASLPAEFVIHTPHANYVSYTRPSHHHFCGHKKINLLHNHLRPPSQRFSAHSKLCTSSRRGEPKKKVLLCLKEEKKTFSFWSSFLLSLLLRPTTEVDLFVVCFSLFSFPIATSPHCPWQSIFVSCIATIIVLTVNIMFAHLLPSLFYGSPTIMKRKILRHFSKSL